MCRYLQSWVCYLCYVHVGRCVLGHILFCLITIECLYLCVHRVRMCVSQLGKSVRVWIRPLLTWWEVPLVAGAPTPGSLPPCPLWNKKTLSRVCLGWSVHPHLTPSSTAERVADLGEVNFHQWRLAFQWEIYISMHPVIVNLRHLALSPTSSQATPSLQESIVDSGAQRHVWVWTYANFTVSAKGHFVLPGHGRCLSPGTGTLLVGAGTAGWLVQSC